MRAPRDAKLETREARRGLAKSSDVYWRSLGQGLALGYRRGRWWVRERTNGHYAKRSIGQSDDHAEANGRDVLSYRDACRLAYGGKEAQELARDRAYTVADAIEDYMRWYKAHRKAVQTTTVAIERRILPELGRRAVEQLTAREIRAWHERIADSPAEARRAKGGPKRYMPIDNSLDEDERKRRRKATANRVLTILKASLSHAFREGYVDSDLEWRRVRPFREVDAPRIRFLDTGEATRLLNACEADFRKIVHGALLTGCRYGELRNMTCADYHPDGGTVLVRMSKAGKRRHVPLTEEGVELVELLTAGRSGGAPMFVSADGSRWRPSHQVRRMKATCTVAEIAPSVRFNDLRHSYASLLAMRGTPLDVIAEALGHADTRMTKRHYAHLTPSYVADTVRANLPRFSKKKRPRVARLRR